MADTYTKARLKEKDTTNFLHPETEVDQIKKTGGTGLASIITTLLKAATTSEARAAVEAAAATHQHSTGDITNFAQNVVSAIGEQTLEALGVRYSITTNGYICFGQLFGGLILQWTCPIVPEEQQESPYFITFPITYNTAHFNAVWATPRYGSDAMPTTVHVWDISNSGCYVAPYRITNTTNLRFTYGVGAVNILSLGR